MGNNKNLQIVDILPLTDMQKTMLFSYLLNPENKAYFEQQRYRITGVLNEDVIKKAWLYVIKSNEMLRSVVRWKNLNSPVLIIYQNKQVPIIFNNCDSLEGQEFSDLLDKNLWEKNGSLEDELYSINLCKLTDSEYHMIISSHHIILDGWSHYILIQEFLNAYIAILENRELGNVQKTPYKEYIRWLNLKACQCCTREKNFWDNYLRNYIMSKDTRNSYKKNYCVNTGIFSFTYNIEIYTKLKTFVKTLGITLAALIYSAWGILLLQQSCVNDVLFGITLSGRNIDLNGVANLAGLFIKTIPMIINRSNCQNKKELLSKVSSDLIEIQNQSYASLKDLVKHYHKINFDSVIVIQNYTKSFKMFKSNIMKVELISSHYVIDIDLLISVRTLSDCLEVEFCYNKDLYSENVIKDMNKELYNVLEEFID